MDSLAGLELDHAATRVNKRKTSRFIRTSIPVCALLVQNTVTALLATDGVAALESNFGIAVTAQVLDAAVGVLEGVLVCDLEASVVVGLLLRHDCDVCDEYYRRLGEGSRRIQERCGLGRTSGRRRRRSATTATRVPLPIKSVVPISNADQLNSFPYRSCLLRPCYP